MRMQLWKQKADNNGMRRFLIVLLILLMLVSSSAMASTLREAYEFAKSKADPATRDVVELIDIDEFEQYYGLTLGEDDVMLMKIALMAYSNGAMLAHPAGISNQVMITNGEYPFIGNMNSMKFHYSWCSSVSDIADHNKKTFRSIEEAENAGLKPCKRCNPIAAPTV